METNRPVSSHRCSSVPSVAISSNWTDVPIHFVDFEGSRSSGILEYGVATLDGGDLARTRTRLCGATGRVREEDTAVHGLRSDDVAAQAPLADDW